MSRRAKGPWYWVQRDSWCATIDGRRVVLVKGRGAEREARRAWHRLMGEDRSAKTPALLPLRQLCGLFLDQAKPRVAPATYEYYKRILDSLTTAHPKLDSGVARPYHIDQWLALHTWAQGTRRGAIAVTKVMFRWAKRRGYLDADPMADLEKPAQPKREVIPSPEQARTIMDAIPEDDPYRFFLVTIWATGCRPGEAAKVEAKDIDADGTWTIVGKTTAKTGRMRKVYATPGVAELCRALAAAHPEGPIFRNSHGHPWNRRAYGQRMRRLRTKLGMGPEVVCYSFRHLFATDAQEKGVPPADVAALLGHSSVAMLSTYSKLHTRDDHLRTAARFREASRSDPPEAPGTSDEG